MNMQKSEPETPPPIRVPQKVVEVYLAITEDVMDRIEVLAWKNNTTVAKEIRLAILRHLHRQEV